MDINAKTLPQIAEEWATLANGGSKAQPTKVSWQATERDVDSTRATILFNEFQVVGATKPMRLNDQCVQAPIVALSSTQPEFLDLPFCYYVYDVEPVISLGNGRDGFLSVSGVTQVGSSNGLFNQFRLSGFEQWRNIVKRGTRTDTLLYWWYQDGQLNLSRKLKAVKVRGVFASPYQVRTYDVDTATYSYMLNPDTSPYPVSGDILDKMRDYWLKSKGIFAAQGQKDTSDDGNINTK